MAITDALQRKRLRLLLRLFVGILGALVVFRVGYWMIIRADWLRDKASAQWILELPVEPQRGNIEDRNGNILAASVTSNTVVLHPKAISPEELPELVDALALILDIDRETIENKAKKTNYSVVWLDRQISQEQSQLIRELNSSGVSLAEDKKRYYPLGNFLTQVLGFTSVDGEGLEGIESRFDHILHGTPGSIVTETDRDGNPIPGSYEQYKSPIEGNNIKLTIDIAIQSYAEKALDICMQENKAKNAIAIVMDCNTGEILAMVSKPDFDNNEPPRHDIELLRDLTRNISTSNQYEPGSIFRLISLAAALDSNTITSDYETNCPGYYEVEGKKLICWNYEAHGHQGLKEVMQNSCNVVIADIGQKMGVNTLYKYLNDFGLGVKSNIELYGEASGTIISPKYIEEDNLTKIVNGQSISLTPLQLVSAVSAIVNGGDLMKPMIIKEETSPRNEIIQSFGSEKIQSVISYNTSILLNEMLVSTVEYGNGYNVRIDGYKIGGMSSTSQKYDEDGYIVKDKHVASFIAAAPMNNPQIVVLVIVDEPETEQHYGSLIAAPYVKMIMEDALPYLSIMSDVSTITQRDSIILPDVIGMSVSEAESTLRRLGIDSIVEGYEGKIAKQLPKEGSNIDSNKKVMMYLEKEDDQNIGQIVDVPNLVDLGVVEANNALLKIGLKIRVNGVGSVVISQYPSADSDAYIDDVVIVTVGYPENDEE
ncbi:MAG: PASTA domain-containing protein [Clostridiales bacterium]|nr:PASTA domain-containing protein [Clostridiales bacterium]